MKPFNAAIIALFIVLGLAAIAVIATFTGGGGTSIGVVSVWGPLPESVAGEHIDDVKISRDDFGNVTYTELPAETFIPTLVEAIAGARGPDLVIFPLEYLLLHGDKLTTIPYSSVSRRQFQDTYTEANEALLESDGIKGLPYIVDPLVLYWNRTLFSQSSIARPPKYWDEVSENAARLTTADTNGSLSQSAVALGEWDNVFHAKEILLSLLRQLGNPVVENGSEGIVVTLTLASQNSVSSAESVFRYYTEFADPVKPVYSWNRSQALSRDAFLSGRLAMYIGYASELSSLRAANPNLNFDVAALPIARGAGTGVSAQAHILAVPRGSQNPNGALSVALVLSGIDAQKMLAEQTSIPSVRRDLPTVSPDDPYAGIFRDAALSAFVFLDLNPAETTAIFKRVVDNISSGRLRVNEAVNVADDELRALVKVR